MPMHVLDLNMTRSRYLRRTPRTTVGQAPSGDVGTGGRVGRGSRTGALTLDLPLKEARAAGPEVQMTDEQRALFLYLQDPRTGGYTDVRLLEDGTFAALLRLAFTIGLHTGLGPTGWKRRYCYTTLTEARAQLLRLRSWDQEPTGYVARRPELPSGE